MDPPPPKATITFDGALVETARGTSSSTETWVVPTSVVIRRELRSFELVLSNEDGALVFDARLDFTQQMDFIDSVSATRIVWSGERDTLSELLAFVVLYIDKHVQYIEHRQ
jgi:hypothetical protein